MRLLLFSDLHTDLAAAASIVERAAGFDAVVGAGDFAVKRRGLATIIEVLAAIETPTVLVPGNGESAEELSAACRGWPAAHVLHGEGVGIGGVPFFGLGGGVPVTPFGSWSYDFTEDEARDLLAPCSRPSNAPAPASSSAATSTAHGASAPGPATPRSSTPAPQASSGVLETYLDDEIGGRRRRLACVRRRTARA